MEDSRQTESNREGPLPDLAGALRAVPGCLGVRSAVTDDGTEVLFAWFHDREAVLRWYHSSVHQTTMRGVFPGFRPRGPLHDLPDHKGPILAIASLKVGGGPLSHAGGTAPIGEIAIELYAPLPGGLFLGRRFAPVALDVPGMRGSRSRP